MKKLITTIVILITSTVALFAVDTVTVHVVDRDLDMPLEGVSLQLVGSESESFTGPDGAGKIPLPDGMRRCVLLASIPGYESVRKPFSRSEKTIELEMVLAGSIIQGHELVVERTKPGKSDEKTGVSVVMDAEEMETTANVGVVEDVMSSVKTLPGVGYTNNWNAQPSIRGGYPDELSCTLDSFYVTYPYHWGGGYSIFNPNMIKTAKLSHGIYSARYGRALSGLLEVTSKKPEDPAVHLSSVLSTTSFDFFLQTPVGSKAGLFLGGKLTYLESMKLIAPDQTESLKTMPYIRDLYAAFFYKPNQALELNFNGFIGTDGLAQDMTIETGDHGIKTKIDFEYVYSNSFISSQMKWMPTDRFFIDTLIGHNINWTDMDARVEYFGSREYSQEFLDYWNSVPANGDTDSNPDLVNGESSYSIDGYYHDMEAFTNLQQTQVKTESDWLINQNHILAVGVEEVLAYTNNTQHMDGWTDVYQNGVPTFEPYSAELDVEGNRSFNSAVFICWEFGGDQGTWQGETGLRVDHFYIWNPEENYSLNTYPTTNPRLNLWWTPIRRQGRINSLTLSGGSGLFSDMPLDANLADEDFGISDFEVSPNQALFNVLGSELLLNNGWKFQLEGYYKHYLSRLVVSENILTGDFSVTTKGKGWIGGFDLLLQKKVSRSWDGYLSYSYIYSRFFNPYLFSDHETEVTISPSGEPQGEWYFPYYHRFHNLNLVFNYHPTPRWTFTLKGSLASGTPRDKVGKVDVYAAYFNEDVIERYTRTSEYSDTLRNGVSAPIDFRIAYNWFPQQSKMEREVYLGVQDALVNLYTPKTNSTFDEITGEERTDTSADFTIGIPIISFGFKMSY